MSGFFELLVSPDVPFIRNALFAGILSSVLFGILGSIVTVKRIAGLAGAISHAVLGGIGIALYLSAAGIVPDLSPMVGAIIFALLSAFLIGGLAEEQTAGRYGDSGHLGDRDDIGVLFMAKTPAYTDPSSYLFGNILLISGRDLILLRSWM